MLPIDGDDFVGQRRRRSSPLAACFGGCSRGTRTQQLHSRRRPAAAAEPEAEACRPAACACSGAAVPPGLVPEEPSPTPSEAEERRRARPVTSPRCAATLRRREQLSDTHMSFVFALDADARQRFAFRPGQAVDLFVPSPSERGGFESRPGPFSIASTPRRLTERGELQLVVKKGGRGVPSRWLENDAKAGDVVECAHSPCCP